ncbi:DUF4855 domain-containing protein [Thermococcus prieurii]
MSKFGLWWIKWNGSRYESRMTRGGKRLYDSSEVVDEFAKRGFDRIVFLGSLGFGGPHVPESGTNQDRYDKLNEYVRALCEGRYDWGIDKDNPNWGESRYKVGRSDGRYFARWASTKTGSMKYYVPIPFSYDLQNKIIYKGKKDKEYPAPPRDCPMNGFDDSYWQGWIDGVLDVSDNNRIGFYWSYESCLQGTNYDPNFYDYFEPMCKVNAEKYVNKYIKFIKNMSDYIHDHNLEFIWIPATGTRDVKYLKNDSGIPVISGYFDYVFIQPNYYQYNLDYTYEKLVEKIRWVYEELSKKIREQNPNTKVSIEMEADKAVLPGQNGHCASCKHENQYKCKNGDNEKCRERACQYVWAILEVYSEVFNRRPPIPPDRAIDTLFPNRAYYFGTDFTVIDKVRETCPEW